MKTECCGNPLRGCMDCPPQNKAIDNMPPLPSSEYGLAFYDEGGAHELPGRGYTADQMHAYARAYAEQRVGPLVEAVAQWRTLYMRAINEANGLTNYVEDRPELRSAERRITSIEAEARASMMNERDPEDWTDWVLGG